MKTYTEKFKLSNNVKITVYLNNHVDENYTGIAAYLKDTCIYEKKVHGLYTVCDDLPDKIRIHLNTGILSGVSGISYPNIDTNFTDCKFIN